MTVEQQVSQPATIEVIDQEEAILHCAGTWNILGVGDLDRHFTEIHWPTASTVHIDASAIDVMDSAGAWLLEKCIIALQSQDKQVSLTGVRESHGLLLKLVRSEVEAIETPLEAAETPSWFYRIGREMHSKIMQVNGALQLIGEASVRIVYAFRSPRRFQLSGIVNIIETTGYQALPIIALLLFLIGVVLAYQMGVQLKAYGANIYVVNLSSMAILREFAPLITAIIVAGRTASSFTAEIGLMMVNEEVDALRTMGLSPVERLVLPKIFGLVIALPLLTFWADVFGVLGSMAMAKGMLDVGYYDFIIRFQNVVPIDSYIIGLVKAPVFAVIIAVVGCYQGFQVASSAESVGRQTTKSVVQAIFLIIIVDGIFSVLFSFAGI